MEPPTIASEEQIERLIKTLERIAYALELANTQTTQYVYVQPQAQPPSVSGYQCPRCYSWVAFGHFHSCGGSSGGSLGGSGSYVSCGATGPNGGKCYLPKDHSSTHYFAVVTNGNG